MLRNILTIAILFSLQATTILANPFNDGTKYRIVSNNRKTGAIGLGSYHGSTYQVYYVEDDADLSDDCWWYIEVTGTNEVNIKNVLTGDYLSYTSKKKTDEYSCLWLTSHDEAQPWNVMASDVMNFVFYVEADVPRYMRVAPLKEGNEANMVKTDKYSGIYTYFDIYDEHGNKLTAADLDDDTTTGRDADPEPTITTDLSLYATDIEINGRHISYMSNLKKWLAVMPEETDGNIEIGLKGTEDALSATLSDGETTINKVADLQTLKDYTLTIFKNNTAVKSTQLCFTTLPVIDLRHGGEIKTGMIDYVWGHFYLSSPDNEQTVYLSAKYKTRGATAANWSKRSLNMKLRDYDTGAEQDSTLLSLRQASSWILDAMAIDRIKMRNRVCFDLWNEFSKLPYETDFQGRNGTVGRFVEVLFNGEYQGIYCLTDKINRKLLNLKKPKTTDDGTLEQIRGVLYKSNLWDYTGLTPSQRGDWEELMGDTRGSTLFCNWELQEPEDYPCKEAWQPLYDLYDYATDNDSVKKHFFLENIADFHLFALTFCLGDNGNKNEFLSIRNITKSGEKEAEEYDRSRFVFTPWDLDASLGGRYDGEIYYDGTYNDSDIKDYRISQNAPFRNLLHDNEYLNLLKQHWSVAREGAFSAQNVKNKLDSYADLFTQSGAYAREQAAWTHNNQLVKDLKKEVSYIEDWYTGHIEKLNEYLDMEHFTQDIVPLSIEQDQTNAIYDLSGRRISPNAAKTGFYICGKKKFFKSR